jgi:thiol-disulfide isomerase/thioredoxin
MNRRHLVFGGVAVAAAVAGAGLAWWRADGGRDANEAQMSALWAMAFDTPDGASLKMQALRGRPLLINFWATWCPPCIEELPLLERFYQKNVSKGWQILGLAVDQPSAVKGFMARKIMSFPVGLAGLDGTELSASLGNPSGSLPFTVFINAGGKLADRKVGRLSEQDLTRWQTSV